MLIDIYLKNFVIVKSLSLQFDSGLSILTGETGAGKSIWVDAVAVALGERADTQYIGTFDTDCEIVLNFDISRLPWVQEWLKNEGFEAGDTCLIRRVIDLKSPARNKINGVPCTVSQLKQLGGQLVHVHSQHQHQALLQKDYQMRSLDRFA